uniref:Uncharacterized protein n=1 Tax=Rhizophora mucronata TaxID=61149 RepID=A0A2P2QDG4_RHIMU
MTLKWFKIQHKHRNKLITGNTKANHKEFV